jgi:mannose-6-phosphate isomerase-like protein (cupin superfamily)
MHDTPDQVHWHEPKAGENAGLGKFKRAPMPYDRFMEAEGVPVYRGIGVRRVQDLPLATWKRLGGRGSYIQLYGTEGLWGLYVVEVPGAGALNVERHLYEKVVLVIEGRGTTEVWQEGQTRRHVFEWQAGSLFSIPLNACHRIVNAASHPALLLCGTTAPTIMSGSSSIVLRCSANASAAPMTSSSPATTSSPTPFEVSPCGAPT